MAKFARFEDVPAGYFLALVRKFNWPPQYEPTPWRSVDVLKSRLAATRAREDHAKRGVGWRNGSIADLSEKGNAAIRQFQLTPRSKR